MMDVKKILKQLTVRQTAIGKERDKLRDLESECEQLRETCERAYDDLGNAISALSELT